MILEKAELYIKSGESELFEKTFRKAKKIIASMKGFVKLDLLSCTEENSKYLLLVTWETIEDHEIGFRQSIEYQEWKELLHHFYEPFPVVEHYTSII
ncbi:antibiotic biosynthesis monooxygenase [uncultured Aquimarina sp.]|uniref:antibiotic biosynthesis monooxygenase family protein n=1 Tax=uncultured Aquimarina sp. TaxID=575652 RepID=UPI00261F155F|nr:antibiotic biosynthesis monooxygenase [uncultured Aquimarina sp.]